MSAETMMLDRLLDRVVREVEDRVSHQNEGKEARLALAEARKELDKLQRVREENVRVSKSNELLRKAASEAEPKLAALYEAADALRKEVSKGGNMRSKAIIEKTLALSEALNAAQGYCAVIPF